MRKVIITIFISVGLLFGVIATGPAVPLVHLRSAEPPAVMSAGLQEDLQYVMTHAEGTDLTVSVSHEGFFYGETISVSITASNQDAAIYYTTSGSDPTGEGGYNTKYTGPLVFKAEEDVKCYVLKAIAIDDGGQSEVLTHSYFVGENVDERFQTPYVFSLSTDDDNLYGYENGILIPGKLYDDYMAEKPDASGDIWRRPANYNLRGRESERPVNVEILSQNGNRLISQNAGLRVQGRTSRTRNQKSLRIIARREYEPGAGRFGYGFFDEHYIFDDYRKPIPSYDTLVLRTESHETAYRNTLASLIAKEAGFSVAAPYSTATVFINGEYYGFTNLTARINEQYLQDAYGAPERAFDINELDNSRLFSKGSGIHNEEIQEIISYIEQGLDDQVMRAAEEFFDVDNLLFYYAIRAYLADFDWPQNNVIVWRYTGTLDTDSPVKELDGRWRFIMYDLDATFYRRDDASPERQSVRRLLKEDTSPIFRELIGHDEYAEKFSNYICDLAFEHYSIDNLERTVERIDGSGFNELLETIVKYYGEGELPELITHRGRVTEFARLRPENILAELRELFGYTDMYRVISDGSCKISTLNGNEGMYFAGNFVTVTPKLEKWQAVDYWLVNGEKRYNEDELTVSVYDAGADGVVNVSLFTREELPPLVFTDTFDTGDLCGFTMYNPNDAVQSTRGLYLSDNINNLTKWPFPAMNVRPGSSWEFVGRNSTSIDSLLKLALNFNPRQGEVIFLSNEDGDVLDYVMMESALN